MGSSGSTEFQQVIKSGLGPHTVGMRVVVRRILPGETGPTGGPAFTDLLGVCEAWGPELTTIRAEDGSLTEIALADIVSGKPVPPRPSRFSRWSDDEVESRATALFVPAETEEIGDWVLRFTGGNNRRPNSVLPVGDPGVSLDEALRRVHAFYAGHGRTPVAQVVVGSAVQVELEHRGWHLAAPTEPDAEVQLAGVAAVSRLLADVDTSAVTHEPAISRAWLTGNDSALANYDAVAASLALPRATFATIEVDGQHVAHGRISLEGDWAFVADLMVAPSHRRHGLARTMMAALVEWAAEQGASVLLLQVTADNAPAQALYAGLGFERHHAYRHLVAPEGR